MDRGWDASTAGGPPGAQPAGPGSPSRMAAEQSLFAEQQLRAAAQQHAIHTTSASPLTGMGQRQGPPSYGSLPGALPTTCAYGSDGSGRPSMPVPPPLPSQPSPLQYVPFSTPQNPAPPPQWLRQQMTGVYEATTILQSQVRELTAVNADLAVSNAAANSELAALRKAHEQSNYARSPLCARRRRQNCKCHTRGR